MLNRLKQLAKSMVISDQFLDVDEEQLYFARVDEFGLHREMGETILSEVLNEAGAARESQLIDEFRHYLEGPLRDGFLDSEEERNALNYIMNHTNKLSLPRAKEILEQICRERSAVIERLFAEELLDHVAPRVQKQKLSEEDCEQILDWATKEKKVPLADAERLLEDICLEQGWQSPL